MVLQQEGTDPSETLISQQLTIRNEQQRGRVGCGPAVQQAQLWSAARLITRGLAASASGLLSRDGTQHSPLQWEGHPHPLGGPLPEVKARFSSPLGIFLTCSQLLTEIAFL